MTKESTRPLCPKCNSPCARGGTSDYGVPRWRCSSDDCLWNGTQPINSPDSSAGLDRTAIESLDSRLKNDVGRRRYVITAAQNATPIHAPFLANLLSYCKKNRAQLVVIPYRYKNPTSMWSADAESDDWWAPELTKYLYDRRINPTPKLTLLADIKTQPTAQRPLTGYETITGPRSAIVGHPKIEFTTVPAPQSRMAKIVCSTGAVTKTNYIPSKIGKIAEFHHAFGAVVVETNGKRFHIRQINALSDGSFCELDHEYKSGTARKIEIEALVMGDSHIRFIDPRVVKATFVGKSSIVG